jgi:chorismate lyase / 3-hydroxybenzoate synthase
MHLSRSPRTSSPPDHVPAGTLWYHGQPRSYTPPPMSQPPFQVRLASSRDADQGAPLLAEIRFGHETGQDPDDARRIRVGVPSLFEGPDREWWLTDTTVTHGWRDGIGYAQGDSLLFAHIHLPDTTDMAAAAREAYERLLAFHRDAGYTALLRIWNYFDRLLESSRQPGLDRYQAFCAGRHEALEAAGLEAATLPAATAIGTETPGLIVYLLAGREPGAQIENPRQVSAYHYPPDYGPRSPTFSRATLKAWPTGPQLFISGTASIVGHASLHEGDVLAQADEIMDNLGALIGRVREQFPVLTLNGPQDLSLLKVYVRNAADADSIRERVQRRIGDGPAVIFLRGDICRRELLTEIEGLHA